MSNIFKGYQFALELDYSFRYKQKQELKKKITNNGGTISCSLTNETNFLIVSNIKKAESTYKGRTAQKYGTPIVTIDFVNRCVKERRIVDATHFLAIGTEFGEGKIKAKKLSAKKSLYLYFQDIPVWKWGDNKAPEFDEEKYEVAKSCLLVGSTGVEESFYQIELHVVPTESFEGLNEEKQHCFRVLCHHGNCNELKDETSGTKECRYLLSSSDALRAYSFLYKSAPANYTKSKKFISRWIGSDKQRKIAMANSFESASLSTEVVELVEHIWQEANEELHGVLSLPDKSVEKKQVEKAEATLLQIRQVLDRDQSVTELDKLSKKFFELIPLQKGRIGTIRDKQMLAKVYDICQLLKDIVSVSEATDFSARSSIESKYRALQCHIEHLPSSTPEYKKISHLVKFDNERKNKFDIKNIFAVNRPIEETNFTHHVGNNKLLFHASKPANFVGIFTRGLLLPKIVVDDFGGKRTDPGNLGSGIYFTDSSSTSGKYSSRSTVKGTRFMLVNDVALGNCLDMKSKDYKLSAAPEGYNSVHGVKRMIGQRSHFTDDEFVVYNTNQQRIRYLVEFAVPEDSIKDIIQMSLKGTLDQEDDVQAKNISIEDLKSIVNPLDKVQAGLQSKDNCSVPLTAVHIRAKLIDLAAQAYRNDSNKPIEAKYVFPLDDMAAVCGFEAFINGKHIIGEVKDKEVAHREYKEAISKGHGAYLMDEETPDVFTVSVGNLPPDSEVLIKITYVAELAVDSGNIVFNLPGNVAPWKKDSALSVTTQEQMKTVDVSGQPIQETSTQIAIEMPYDIRSIKSPTHVIKIKQSSTKATVELRKNVKLGKNFQLLIELAEIHVPRMWVEKHPDKPDTQACMLTFYPEFESKATVSPEILLVLDLSNSMKGESLMQAKKILLLILDNLPIEAKFNVITFGTNFDELFQISQDAAIRSNIVRAKLFIRNAHANMGNTEVWRPLHSYFLLSDATSLRNIFLISDGHINNEESTLAAIRLNAKTNRVFTFGISATANKHLLRAIARVGTGAFEFFDTSTKSKWERKIKGQLLKARQPALNNVTVEWQQFDDNACKPIQAPRQITSLFSGSRQVVYGYVPFCRQATLKAEINGEEISTTVSTNEFNVTRGKILHQLTARAIIRDWEDGTLDADPVEHDIKKDAQKSYIIELSKEYSIVTQFTSFVAIEEREKTDFVGAIFKQSIIDLVAKEDVDDLLFVNWEELGPYKAIPLKQLGRVDYLCSDGLSDRNPFKARCNVSRFSRSDILNELGSLRLTTRMTIEDFTPELLGRLNVKSANVPPPPPLAPYSPPASLNCQSLNVPMGSVQQSSRKKVLRKTAMITPSKGSVEQSFKKNRKKKIKTNNRKSAIPAKARYHAMALVDTDCYADLCADPTIEDSMLCSAGFMDMGMPSQHRAPKRRKQKALELETRASLAMKRCSIGDCDVDSIFDDLGLAEASSAMQSYIIGDCDDDSVDDECEFAALSNKASNHVETMLTVDSKGSTIEDCYASTDLSTAGFMGMDMASQRQGRFKSKKGKAVLNKPDYKEVVTTIPTIGFDFNSVDFQARYRAMAAPDTNCYDPTIEDSIVEEDFLRSHLCSAGFMDMGMPSQRKATKKRGGLSFGFPKFRKKHTKAEPNHLKFRAFNYALDSSVTVKQDIKKDNEIDVDLLSYYQREDPELGMSNEECEAICRAVKRIPSRQINNGSWVIKSLRELLKLEASIQEHAQRIAGDGNASKHEIILCTAVVVCLLEHVLLSWKSVWKNGKTTLTYLDYRNVFQSLVKGERLIHQAKKQVLPLEGTTWVEYAEKNLLGLNVGRLSSDVGDQFNFTKNLKRDLWGLEQPWMDKSFWRPSAGFAVMFDVKRQHVVAILEQAGIKSLGWKIQEDAAIMLSLAIGIKRLESVTYLRVGTKQLNRWLDEMEKANYGIASHLALGTDWRDVASKFCKNNAGLE